MAYAFSEDLKWRVIFLRHNGYSRKKIAELLCVSIGLVNKVWQIYVKWETVVNPWQKSPGRCKTLNRNDMKVFDK
jgi:transposase